MLFNHTGGPALKVRRVLVVGYPNAEPEAIESHACRNSVLAAWWGYWLAGVPAWFQDPEDPGRAYNMDLCDRDKYRALPTRIKWAAQQIARGELVIKTMPAAEAMRDLAAAFCEAPTSEGLTGLRCQAKRLLEIIAAEEAEQRGKA